MFVQVTYHQLSITYVKTTLKNAFSSRVKSAIKHVILTQNFNTMNHIK